VPRPPTHFLAERTTHTRVNGMNTPPKSTEVVKVESPAACYDARITYQ
jgi:hypothetical protein